MPARKLQEGKSYLRASPVELCLLPALYTLMAVLGFGAWQPAFLQGGFTGGLLLPSQWPVPLLLWAMALLALLYGRSVPRRKDVALLTGVLGVALTLLDIGPMLGIWLVLAWVIWPRQDPAGFVLPRQPEQFPAFAESSLLRAAAYGDWARSKALLIAGADPNAVEQGYSPLAVAKLRADQPLVQLLKAYGASVEQAAGDGPAPVNKKGA